MDLRATFLKTISKFSPGQGCMEQWEDWAVDPIPWRTKLLPVFDQGHNVLQIGFFNFKLIERKQNLKKKHHTTHLMTPPLPVTW